jgi:hypothetical protein
MTATEAGLKRRLPKAWWTTVKDPECERYNRRPDVRIEL